MADDGNLQVVSDLLTDFVGDKVKGLIEKKKWMEECAFNLVSKREELTALVDKLIELNLCALDLETTSLNTRQTAEGKSAARIVGVCLAESRYVGYYVPVSHEDKEFNLPYDFVVRELARLVKNCRCIYHFFKYDGQVLHNHGIDIYDETTYEDTYLMAGVDDASSRERGLKFLSERHLGREMIDINKLGVQSGKKKLIRFDLVPPQIALYYGCSDAMNTFGLYEHYTESLNKQDPDRKGGPWAVYERIEKRCQFAVMTMERNLCRIDIQYLQEQRKILVGRMQNLLKMIYDAAGREFDVKSPKQMGIVLFEEMKLKYPEKEKTASGQYKTDEGTLMKISGAPIVKMVLEYRGLEKVVGTYVDNFLVNVDEKGYVKFQLNQLRADTGRFSASGGKGLKVDGYSGVNCQNIPRPDEDDAEKLDLRGAIIATEGYKIVTVDYSGEELRIATNFSREPKWLDVFMGSDADLHLMTAKVIYNDPRLTAKDKKQRGVGKTINFLTLFGGGASRFSAQAKIPFDTAKKMIINFFRGYPVLKRWIDDEIKRSRKRGFSKTAFGRRRHLREFYSSTDDRIRAKGDRCAVNSAIQGTGADIIKIALYRVWKWLRDNGCSDDVRMLMPIHDEIVFEIREEKLDFYIPELCEVMKLNDLVEALGWPIFLDVDAEYGDSFHVDHDYWEERGLGAKSSVPAPKEPISAPKEPAPTAAETSKPHETRAEEGDGVGPHNHIADRNEKTPAPGQVQAQSEAVHTVADTQCMNFTITVREAMLAASEKARDRLEEAESTEPDEALQDVRVSDRIDHRGVFMYPMEKMDIVTVYQLEAALRVLAACGDGMFVGPKCRVSLVERSTGEVWFESSKKVSLDAFLAICLWLKI